MSTTEAEKLSKIAEKVGGQVKKAYLKAPTTVYEAKFQDSCVDINGCQYFPHLRLEDALALAKRLDVRFNFLFEKEDLDSLKDKVFEQLYLKAMAEPTETETEALGSELKKLYKTNWCLDFTTMEALVAWLKQKAAAGDYTAHVYVDSHKQYWDVKYALAELGLNVDDYNGGGNGIIEIDWS